MASKSVLNDSKQVERAVALIKLGARLQVLESETNFSYYENSRHFECGLCTPPARAGKGAAGGGIQLH